MKTSKTLLFLILSVISVSGLTSCSSTSSASNEAASNQAGGQVINKPLASAQQSALHALATVGADVTVNKPNYVEGKRPHKMGLMVGSGGETIKVSLTAVNPQQTSVSVKTSKSVLGIVGQKNWDNEVLAAMR